MTPRNNTRTNQYDTDVGSTTTHPDGGLHRTAMQKRGMPVTTRRRRYRSDSLAEMSVPELVAGYRTGSIAFEEVCDTVRRRSYHATRAELQQLAHEGVLTRDECSYLKGELLCTHLHEFF